jgi:hypothetical protein
MAAEMVRLARICSMAFSAAAMMYGSIYIRAAT